MTSRQDGCEQLVVFIDALIVHTCARGYYPIHIVVKVCRCQVRKSIPFYEDLASAREFMHLC